MSSIPQTESIKNSTLEQPQQRGLHNTINNAWRRLHPTSSSAPSRETVLSKAKSRLHQVSVRKPVWGVFHDSYLAHPMPAIGHPVKLTVVTFSPCGRGGTQARADVCKLGAAETFSNFDVLIDRTSFLQL